MVSSPRVPTQGLLWVDYMLEDSICLKQSNKVLVDLEGKKDLHFLQAFSPHTNHNMIRYAIFS